MKFKKLLCAVLVLCAVCSAVFLLSSCKDDTLPDNSGGISIKLYVLDLDNTVLFEKEIETDKSSLFDVFNEIAELQVQCTSSFLGAWVNNVQIGEILTNDWGEYFNETARIPNTASQFISVYHDIDELKLKDLSVGILEFDNKQFFFSGEAVNKLPLYNGAVYILKLSEFWS